MVVGNQNLEWQNHNSIRQFPISADADVTDTSGSFVLPESFILALYLTHVSLNVDPGQFFVKTIGVYATGFSVVVGYQPADDSPAVPVASAQISRATHTAGDAYNLGGLKSTTYDFSDCRGRITIGDISDIDLQPAGLWQFTLDSGRLEADAIRPMIRGLTSISIANGDEVVGPLYDHIILRAGTNSRLDYAEVSGKAQITINAIDGAGLNADCVCGDQTAEPILTINGIGPDPAGNFNLLHDNCLNFEEIDNGLLLKDICSQSCCGCPELEKITQALEGFGAEANTIINFLTRLESSVDSMEMTVLSAKLGDRSCLENE